MKNNNYNGSELHRLKPMKEGYDESMFNRLYKICIPVINNLTRQIDYKRLGLTPDLIKSYFLDKMVYVFNKYYGVVSEEHLKADILRSLFTYKNKLLRSAYGDKAVINKGMSSLDELYDNSKEFYDDTEEEEFKSDLIDKVNTYMKNHLSLDAQLVYEVLTTPPPFIKERTKTNSKITNLLLVEFFDLPKSRKSTKYISDLKSDISYWIKRAHIDLSY